LKENGMAKFILGRHGQTAWNAETRFRGRKDVPLSERGLAEAEAVGTALADEGVTRLYASPLSRAMQTLAPLGKRLGREVVPYEELLDMNFGVIEGMLLSEADAAHPELMRRWRETPERAAFPEGETLGEVQARAMRAMSRLAFEFPEDTIAVCSHRVVTKLIMLGLLGVKPNKFWAIRQDTACLNRFTYDPPAAIIFSVNETFHLDRLEGHVRTDF
jgi:broad specificity phosphatase PhoE